MKREAKSGAALGVFSAARIQGQLLRLEVEDQIHIAVAIYIFPGPAHGRGIGEQHCAGINAASESLSTQIARQIGAC